MTRRAFRFAPSPNGALHLGHAYSACLNFDMAQAASARFLLRMEDIDIARCTPAFERAIHDDLVWLGLEWEMPVRRQSEHFADYQAALDTLVDAGLVYPGFMSRGEVRDWIAEQGGGDWPRDPDGAPLYPGIERDMAESVWRRRIGEGEPFAWRLDVAGALAHARGSPGWDETGAGPGGETGHVAGDAAAWGDVVVARREIPTSYHLAVVVDDALQGITDVVRGRDLFHATSVHRLLQDLLGFAPPLYHHHRLVLDADGRKLSKSRRDTALGALRAAGATPGDIRRMVGLD